MTKQIQEAHHYRQWLIELKLKFRKAQIRAAVSVNSELLQFYWDLGSDIVQKQTVSKWGDGFLRQLSADLKMEFPEVKGFSLRNLELIRQWFRFWNQPSPIAKQAVSQLLSIPWGHNLAIIKHCKDHSEALYYVQNTQLLGWSRSVLRHQIESELHEREGNAVTNFRHSLPPVQSDLAQQTIKDPYIFDFFSLSKNFTERELENSLVEHITHFLLELGAGFAFMGRQFPLRVGDREFFIDLLFYHARLKCYVVIELKTVEFEPEHAGKLNFYIKAIDEQMRQTTDQPTIGILLCKERDRLVAEYALSDIHKPIGISEYQLTQSLPEALQANLPSIDALEAELSRDLIRERQSND